MSSKQFSKQEVMELILKMKSLNQKEYAVMVYNRENDRHPEWDLRGSFLALKGGK